jgi:hypothetical protein
VTATIVAPLDHGAAERLDKRIRLMADSIRDNLTKIAALIEEAKTGQIHLALGFSSWTAYLAEALGGRLELDTDSRREVVALMSDEGMSNRAIAQAVGVTEITVRRDKEQVRHDVAPAERPEIKAEVSERDSIDELVDWQLTLPKGRRKSGAQRRAGRPVTGLDGKTYTPPAEPSTPRRRPLPDLFPKPVDNLRRVTTQIEKLCDDDRFGRNADSLSRYVGEITRARDALNRILWKLDPDLMIGLTEEDDRKTAEVVAKLFGELEQIAAGAAGTEAAE